MPQDPLTYPMDARVTAESPTAAISWAAIFGGGVVAASVSIVLLLIGSGFGFAMASPWPGNGTSVATFSVVAGIWLIVVQWIASGLGGYITGRLRTKWVRVHTHEVFFRDTAHGLLTWGLATVIGALIFASAGTSAIGTGTRAAATVASSAAANPRAGAMATTSGQGYIIDALFRGEKPEMAASDPATRAEATRIFVHDMANGGDVPAADRSYLASVIVNRTGVSQDDANQRVNAAVDQAKAADVRLRQAADAARKSAAAFGIFGAIAMLIGAFIASAAAAYGGSLRDEHP